MALHFRVLVLIGLLSLVFTSCFLALPNRKSKLRSAIPGALLSAVAWVVFSSVFSFYINNFAHYSHFYGSLTTLVVSMLWLFFCMNILFYGGMVNAWLEQRRQGRRTARRELRG
jgi:membrane protein